MYASVAAISAALTAILAKIGIESVPSTLATAIRGLVVVALAWGVVFVAGEHRAIAAISRRSMLYLFYSGLAAGISWLAYFRALQLGPASRVSPIDKLSLPLTIALAALFLGESISWKVASGVALMTLGALLTIS